MQKPKNPKSNSILRSLRALPAALLRGIGSGEYRRTPMLIEEVEPRILHSADFALALPADGALPPHAEQRLIVSGGEYASQAAHTQPKQSTELVFVDARTPDYQKLVDDIRTEAGDGRSIEVLLLDSRRDGIGQITSALSGRTDVSAVHIVSHGSSGAVQLGNGVLDLQSLRAQSGAIASWSGALTQDADILIYGCDVASSPDGRTLVDALSRLTGADVAASENLTGNAAAQGDWNLEYTTGRIEAALAIDAQTQQAWAGVLNTAPALSGAENLTPITEDAAANPGTQVSTLLAGHVTDPDAGALSGIAVTAANNTNGNWQYSIDAGASWTSLGSPNDTSARLLRSNDFVRFVPNSDFNGTVSNGLTFRAWDQTTGTAGGTVDLTTPATVRDNFDTKAYNNNNGTATWSSAWIDVDNNVNGGSFSVKSGQLETTDNTSTDWLYRQVNLAGASSPTLSFDYTSDLNSGTGGLIDLQMSNNGGASYTTIAVFSNTSNTGTGSFSADISAFATANTRIRFLLAGSSSPTTTLLIDNLQVSYRTLAAGGATAFSAATAGSSITVNPVNDAPVLSPAAPALTTITEDQTGNAGQTVASIVGASISDADTGALPGIAVTAISSGNGTWQYSVNGGTSWSAIGAVSDASALLLGSSDRVRFEPDSQNGTSASITYRAWDQTSGTASSKVDTSTNGGATAFSSTIDTATLTVTAINDAPVHNVPAAQNTITNTAIIFSTGNGNAISVGDADAGSNLVEMTLSVSVSNGTLTLGGSSGLVFSVGTGTGDASMTFTGTIADINAALDGLRYDPTLGYSGSSTLDVTSDDLGSSGAGGPQSVTNTVVMNVAFVNTAPVLSGGNDLGSISEDTATNPGTSVSALIAGHVSDDAGALSGMAVIGVDDSDGTWQYSTTSGATWNDFGTPSAASARLLAADGNSYVRFVPTADWNGSVTNGLTFRAWDRTSGAAGGTADTTSVTNTVRDSFNSVSYSNNDGTAMWSSGWVDTDSNPAGGSIRVTGGELVLSTLLGTDSISREADLSGATSATLSFSYNNQLGLLGTVSLRASSNGGSSYTALATFSSGSNAGSGTFSIDISSYISSNTQIQLVMSGVLLGGSLHADDLQISYVAPANGGTTSFSTATASSSITVNSVNDAPTLSAPAALAVTEDAASAITGISFADIDAGGGSVVATFTVPKGTLAAVSGGSVIVGGSATALTLTGSIANINAFIAASSLTYTTASNDTSSVTLGVSVGDQGNIGSGGPQSSAVSSVTLNVTAVNDAPTGASTTVSTPEDTVYVFTSADFSFSDSGDNPADTLLAVRVTALPSAGSLTLAGAAVSAGQFISATDISLGRLKFMPAANANASGYASFTFQLQDDGGIANGGIDLDPVSRAMIIDVTAVNDTPMLATNAGLVVNEGASGSIGAASLHVTDIDNPAAQLAFAVTAVPTNGHLELTGNPGVPITSFTQDDIDNTRLVYVHDGSQTISDSFTFSVADGAGGSLAATTFGITINAVNDAPANTVPGTQTTEQGSVLMFSAGSGNAIAIADADAGANVVEVKLSASNGTLTLAGTNGLVFALGDGNSDTTMRFTGTIANINAALNGLQFAPGAGYAGAATLSIDSNDLGNTGAGGMLSASSVVSINVVALTSTTPVTPVTPILPAIAAPTVLPPSTAAPVIQPAPTSGASSGDTTSTITEVPAAGGGVENDSPVLAMDPAPTAQSTRGAFYVVNPSTLRNPGSFRATYTLSAMQWLMSGDEAQAAADSGIGSGLNVGYEKPGNALQNPALFDGLDSLRNELQEQSRADELIVASSAAASLGLSVGYVLWLLRGGVLVSSLLSSLPAWRLVDPLPILGRLDDDEDDDEDDSLESLVAVDNTAPAPHDPAPDRKTEFAHAEDVAG